MSSTTVYTYRDAGLHSRLLRVFNGAGEVLARLGQRRPSLSPECILEAARRKTGLSDFGDDAFREALDVLSESLEEEADLSSFGRFVMKGQLVDALSNRLRLLDWARSHPEVREERIERPWIVLGLPRTGTSLLSILFGLDPAVRPLLQWESSHPIPPPDLAGHAEDPRIAETAKMLEQLQALNPPLQAMHPFGATLATECVTLMIYDLRSLSIETQARLPRYGAWLERTDMRSAYAMHRLGLQVLQSRLPTGSWSLKTPNHLWCIDALRKTYPDARLIWTHRDPRKVVPSVASLVTSIQRMNARKTDPRIVGSDWNDKLHLAVTRGMEFDARPESGAWCRHLQYADLMKDPIEAVRAIYSHFGEEVHPLHERRMQAWLRDRSQSAFGRHGYDPADFGLTPEAIAERYADYTERFEIPRED